jgi:hypothetical protein
MERMDPVHRTRMRKKRREIMIWKIVSLKRYRHPHFKLWMDFGIGSIPLVMCFIYVQVLIGLDSMGNGGKRMS